MTLFGYTLMTEQSDPRALVRYAFMLCGDRANWGALPGFLERRSRRPASTGAVYVTLDRLEAKGFLASRLGEPTAARGGRAKRYYLLTAAGKAAVRDECRVIKRMWAGLGLVPD